MANVTNETVTNSNFVDGSSNSNNRNVNISPDDKSAMIFILLTFLDCGLAKGIFSFIFNLFKSSDTEDDSYTESENTEGED